MEMAGGWGLTHLVSSQEVVRKGDRARVQTISTPLSPLPEMPQGRLARPAFGFYAIRFGGNKGLLDFDLWPGLCRPQALT